MLADLYRPAQVRLFLVPRLHYPVCRGCCGEEGCRICTNDSRNACHNSDTNSGWLYHAKREYDRHDWDHCEISNYNEIENCIH